jgi:hypothetical protein
LVHFGKIIKSVGCTGQRNVIISAPAARSRGCTRDQHTGRPNVPSDDLGLLVAIRP